MPELPRDWVLPDGFVPDQPPDPPVVPRPAATVALLRSSANGTAGMEVFLMRRVAGMAFAGGMTVFPGGRVDPRDSDASVAWSGPEPAWWAAVFGCDTALARALVCAAVRETFEESGVLLAGSQDDTEHSVVADATRYHGSRRALESREFSLAQFLAENRLVLRADLLRPWANWVTPEEETRRFDARFFLAVLPAGQRADGATSEAAEVGWKSPQAALAQWRAGRVSLLPPTWATLAELAECGTVQAALDAPRSIEKLVPRVVREDGTVKIVLPGDPRYAGAHSHVEP
jgi:8-oxo-dGTP pyrophosphatase MutT (NUDIX family)